MVRVVGLGPGAKEYILPEARRIIAEAEVVAGASRNLKSVQEFCRETVDLSQGLKKTGLWLKENQKRNIAVVVSGDTGFYSLLTCIKKYVQEENLEVFPGISSLQYFFAKLKRGYEGVEWISLHGRERELTPFIEKKKELALLTDRKRDSRYIASVLKNSGIEGAIVCIGENLSYEDEKISVLTVDEALTYEAADLSVVVIRYEKI